MKALFAGMLIGISCVGVAKVGGTLGNLMFPLALLLICIFKLPLFTGRIGEAGKDDWFDIIEYLFCNILGAWLIRLAVALCSTETQEVCKQIESLKLYESLLETILGALACGFLMQCAVSAFGKGYPIVCALCVFVFLELGFEHSIANAFWVIADWRMLIYILGNAVGAKIAYLVGINNFQNFSKTS